MNVERMDLVSIIIPAFNTEKFISKCLASVISQTYLNIEIIVINDASTDNTLSVVEDVARNESRIKVLSLPENAGNGVCRNMGIQMAKGKYVYFIDSDDYIEKNTIEISINGLYDSGFDVAILGHKEHCLGTAFKKGKIIDKVPSSLINLSKEEIFKHFLLQTYGLYIPPWKYFIKKSFLIENNIFFDESRHYFEDVIFASKLMFFANNILAIQKPLYHYVLRKDSIMGSYSRKFIESKFYAIQTLRDFLKSENVFDSYKEEYSMFFLMEGFMASCYCYGKMTNREEPVEQFLYDISRCEFIQRLNLELIKGTDAKYECDVSTIKKRIAMARNNFKGFIFILRLTEKLKRILP